MYPIQIVILYMDFNSISVHQYGEYFINTNVMKEEFYIFIQIMAIHKYNIQTKKTDHF